MTLYHKRLFWAFLLLITITVLGCGKKAEKGKPEPLMIQEQGSFAIGGTVLTTSGTSDPDKISPNEPTFHGDHAYIFYQIPPKARKHPLVFLHGAGQFSKTWESTPDGREGFQNIFLRRGFGIYLINQPRRGNAGRSTLPVVIAPELDEQACFNIFRIGIWPKFFPGVQFSHDPETLNQYFRQMTPNTGPFDMELISNTIAKLFNKIGPAILVTHSQGGGPGWLAAIKSKNIRAVVAYEPGSNFIFPDEEVPSPLESSSGELRGIGIPLRDFIPLTKIPIVIFYGDNIPDRPVSNPSQDAWRVRLIMAKLWADTVNRHGGDASVIHLPKIGIKGNTHFPFSDLNNLEIADLLSKFLKEKKLD